MPANTQTSAFNSKKSIYPIQNGCFSIKGILIFTPTIIKISPSYNESVFSKTKLELSMFQSTTEDQRDVMSGAEQGLE